MDSATEQSVSTLGRFLAAGIAVAGAGVIAASPVATLTPLTGHQPAVKLTATTSENLDALMDLISGPNPISTALGELAGYYGQVASDSYDGVMNGLDIAWSGGGPVKGLENILPQIMDYLQQGDVLHAWDLINWDLLFDMNNIFQPLFDHTPRGSTEAVPGVLGLGADLTRVMANVQDIFGDFSFWKTSAKYLMEPWLGFNFALSENISGVEGHQPQDPIDALLNGYVVFDEETGTDGARWWGLLTEQGTVSYFLDFLPGKIADALTENLPADDVAPAAAVELGGLDLVDSGLLAGLF